MDQYIKDLSTLIREGEMENTYKMVWIRSIVESCVLDPRSSLIHFDQLSEKIFGYYWNQTIFFGLKQCPNPNRLPKIYQIVLEEIDQYQKTNGYKPEWFSRVKNLIKVPLSDISNVLKTDVCWRFPKLNGKDFDVYGLDKNNRTINVRYPELIKEYSDILFELINYRWTQKLEEFNHSPRISRKVLGTDRERVRRGSLSKFREYLDLENPDRICFFTNKPLTDKDLSIDHILPWSYMYSDDLWNLVYVDRSHNSSKSNLIPDEDVIEKLEQRNQRLLNLMNFEGVFNRHKEELELSITSDLVKKFWVGCKG